MPTNCTTPRTFSFAVLQGYDVLEETVEGVQLRVLYQQAKDNAARHALQTLGDALGVYTELFGQYPFDSLTVAELEMYDGMEYDGLFFLGRSEFATYDYTARNMLTFLVAHETSHNWWFSQVANDQAIDPWLDEALATYCEYLFYERVYPQHLGWWWSFRITYYEPVGWVNATTTTYYDYEAYGKRSTYAGCSFYTPCGQRWETIVFGVFAPLLPGGPASGDGGGGFLRHPGAGLPRWGGCDPLGVFSQAGRSNHSPGRFQKPSRA